MKEKYLKIKKNILKKVKGLQNKLENNFIEKDHDENILKQDLIWAKSLTWLLIGTTISFIGKFLSSRILSIVLPTIPVPPINANFI